MRCAWCSGPIPAAARRDSICCSKRCRQARHRFTRGVGRAGAVEGGQPRRLAYADPPYPGRAKRYYGDHPDYAGEVDHAELIASLSAEYDAWALSTSADRLQEVLALCPPGVRIAAWHRGERPNKQATTPLNAWEPVIYAGAIAIRHGDPDATTRRLEQLDDASRRAAALRDASLDRDTTRRVDSLVAGVAVRLTDPGRVVGAKPAAFCGWLFRLLGAQLGDEFVDVFPGSGGVARAWREYTSRGSSGDASCPPRGDTSPVEQDLRDASRCASVAS